MEKRGIGLGERESNKNIHKFAFKQAYNVRANKRVFVSVCVKKCAKSETFYTS